MGCMKHRCLKCNRVYWDNNPGLMACTQCGGKTQHTFDEPPEARGDWETIYYDGDRREKQIAEEINDDEAHWDWGDA